MLVSSLKETFFFLAPLQAGNQIPREQGALPSHPPGLSPSQAHPGWGPHQRSPCPNQTPVHRQALFPTTAQDQPLHVPQGRGLDTLLPTCYADPHTINGAKQALGSWESSGRDAQPRPAGVAPPQQKQSPKTESPQGQGKKQNHLWSVNIYPAHGVLSDKWGKRADRDEHMNPARRRRRRAFSLPAAQERDLHPQGPVLGTPQGPCARSQALPSKHL